MAFFLAEMIELYQVLELTFKALFVKLKFVPPTASINLGETAKFWVGDNFLCIKFCEATSWINDKIII